MDWIEIVNLIVGIFGTVVGIVGGLSNPVYYNKIMEYVRLKYHKRYLLNKKMCLYIYEPQNHQLEFKDIADLKAVLNNDISKNHLDLLPILFLIFL